MKSLLTFFPPQKKKSLSATLMYELKHASKTHSTPPSLSAEEQQLVLAIREKTERANANNVTRTKAYLNFFFQHPEIHWAFLAHLVSRNAGWTMTDLQGEYLPHLLSVDQQISFFSFLERGNWLIFQDAYPQLLVYQESIKRRKPLFHLLSAFHVSSFMNVVWRRFWIEKDCDILSTALIINEQHYIDSRIIKNDVFHQSVFKTLPFQLQNVFNMNVILFPRNHNTSIQLIGETANHFLYVKERIHLGKRLYQILFSKQEIFNAILDWASHHPHTGSRKDFWPHFFHPVKEGIPGEKRTMEKCMLTEGPRIYSPLLSVWKEVSHEPPNREDWFTNDSALSLFSLPAPDWTGNVAKTYCHSIECLEKLCRI
ncbi:DUF2515 family protein [Alkalihalobacillus hwajinpoensis]|uniref:DUF2515 family protein n=1 Tax=Guptibacillus hwajinpoensis TaxID=208199 RepID=UPI0018844192|nr:DUF2515 family protein [Pseudalkalibacillus hwajinpoensis]MBF0705085.1 DUF2515 family protein [Pseudalkalibacillus hwajinpoensis]